ncbi:hypothetical protein ACA910_005739 [Epithemia clementina (nom. ined.)]
MIQNETIRTAQKLDRMLYQKIHAEIKHEMEKHKAHMSSLPPELGPSGKYYYRWRTENDGEEEQDKAEAATKDHNDYSVYERWINKKFDNYNKPNYSASQAQTLLDTRDVIGRTIDCISLSADETMIAYAARQEQHRLQQDEEQQSTSSDKGSGTDNSHLASKLWIRPIGSYQPIRVPLDHFVPTANPLQTIVGPTPLTGSIVQIEFGSLGSVENGNEEMYLLLWAVACPQERRPFAVYGCNITKPSSQKESGTINPGQEYHFSPVQLIHDEQQDSSVRIELQRTKGGQYVVLNVQTLDSNQLYLISSLNEPPLLVRSRREQGRWHVDVPGDGYEIFIVGPEPQFSSLSATSTTKAGELAVWKATATDLPWSNARLTQQAPWLTATQGFSLFDVDIYHGFVVLYEQSKWNGLPQIRVVDRNVAGQEWVVSSASSLSATAHNNDKKESSSPVMGAASTVVTPIPSLFYHSESFFFALESPFQMRRVFEYRVQTRRLQELYPQDDSATNYKSSFLSISATNANTSATSAAVEQQRVLIASHDGVLVPLTLIRYVNNRSKEPVRPTHSGDNECHSSKPTNTTPVLLTAYGSYGVSLDLSYNPAWQPLLQRGFVLAFAHVRGGGELGQQWHEQGKREHKLNAVQDFIACAEAIRSYLVNDGDGWSLLSSTTCSNSSSSVRITGKAFSAGGVVVASCDY